MSEHPAVRLTQELVRMRTTPDRGQQEVAELLADRLDDAGFDVVVHPCDGGSNVVARLGDPDAAGLCLSGHLDTVPAVEEDWSHDPFGGEITQDRLWGRGASDMKAGAAAVVEAATSFARSGGRAPVSVVLSAEEELGCLGVAELAQAPGAVPAVSALVVAEPTSNRPLLGHRGAVWLDLVAAGRSCHASTPHLGENAIDKLVDALVRVRDWTASHPSHHEVLGARTLSVGRVDGGIQRNIVPDRARAQLDFRVCDPDEVAGLPDALGSDLAGLADVQRVLGLPPVSCPEDAPLVRLARSLARDHVDGPLDAAAARFFTDASVLTPALGFPPTLIWGPGSADLAHVVDEWCSVREIVAATAMFGELLARHAAGDLADGAGAAGARR